MNNKMERFDLRCAGEEELIFVELNRRKVLMVSLFYYKASPRSSFIAALAAQ